MSPALPGRFFTTEPPGKPSVFVTQSMVFPVHLAFFQDSDPGAQSPLDCLPSKPLVLWPFVPSMPRPRPDAKGVLPSSWGPGAGGWPRQRLGTGMRPTHRPCPQGLGGGGGGAGLHWGWTCVLCSLQAAHRLVCAHLPDREAEEEPVPQPGRGGGHPAGHPEGRAPRHPGAAEGRVRAAPESGQKWGLEREAGQSVPDQRAGSLAPWVLVPACLWERVKSA